MSFVKVKRKNTRSDSLLINKTTKNGFFLGGSKLPSYLPEDDTEHVIVTIPETDIELAHKMIESHKVSPFIKIDNSGNYCLDIHTEEAKEACKRNNIEDIIKERNKRLTETDWTQLADVYMDGVTRGKWNDYRRQLRDLPTTGITYDEDFFPVSVNWPTPPQ